MKALLWCYFEQTRNTYPGLQKITRFQQLSKLENTTYSWILLLRHVKDFKCTHLCPKVHDTDRNYPINPNPVISFFGIYSTLIDN